MKALTTEERTALRDAAHRLLTDKSHEAAVRETVETESGYDPVLWRQLAEMGLVGLVIDEAHGGSGAGPLELESVMEEVGAALLCSPLLASGVLAAELLRALEDEEACGRYLADIASGACIATAVITGQSGCWTEAGVSVSAAEGDDNWVLNGSAGYVLHGQNADLLLVAARMREELGVFAVAADSAGVTVSPLPTFDHTLRLAGVSFDNVAADRLGNRRPAWQAIEQALDLTLVALAGEQAGAAEHCLGMTVQYAKDRIQFGRQIGSFQAVKHMAADLLLETESAISAARHAAVQLAENPDSAAEAIHLAAFACADAFVKTTADSIQMHGGIAFTWEHPAHLYLRRARADARLFGSSAFHRECYIQALEG